MPLQADEYGHLTVTYPNRSIIVRSEAMNDIVSRRPGFLSRWALPLFGLILLFVLTGAWFIHYPDIVNSKATLVGMNAPKEIVNRQEGKLIRLLVRNNQRVRKDQVLGWMESNADAGQMLSLAGRIDSAIHLVGRGRMDKASILFDRPYSNLGELQAGYQQFIVALQQFEDYFVNGFYYRKMRLLQDDLHGLVNMDSNFLQQKNLIQQDLKLTEAGYSANALLYKDSVISSQDYRSEQSKLLNKQLSIPQLEAGMLQNGTAQRSKQKEINDLEHAMSQEKMTFLQALQTLKSSIGDWQRRYVFTAPVDGEMVFVEPIQENRFLRVGHTLGFIKPDLSEYYLEANLPQSNFGKIKVGQQVQLRFDAYPYNEFGVVKGELSFVSSIATDSGFVAYIKLGNGLETTQHKYIQFRNGLRADALVITKDVNLLQRLFYTFTKGASQ